MVNLQLMAKVTNMCWLFLSIASGMVCDEYDHGQNEKVTGETSGTVKDVISKYR
jgi:hypothetical protein